MYTKKKIKIICLVAFVCYVVTAILTAILSAQAPTPMQLLQRPRNDIVGWSKQITRDGEFKSVISLHAGGTTPAGDQWTEDQMYAVVERTIDGNDHTFIEQFTPVDWGSDDDYAWFVDGGGAGSTYTPAVDAVYGDGDYTEYLVGFTRGAYGNVVVKAKSDSTINTDWGTDGFWGFVGEEFGGTISCYALFQLSDDRLLVGHNNFWIEGQSYSEGGKVVSVTMLTADGDIDTSWGYNGWYYFDAETIYPYLNIVEILEDLDGNFYFIGGCNFGTTMGYHKVDADGNSLVQRTWNTSPKIMMNPRGALWNDAARTQILVYGGNGNYPSVSYLANSVLLSTTDFEPVQDGSWGGLGHKAADGYANITSEYNPVFNTPIVHDIIKLSDGNYLAKHHEFNDPDVKTLSKFADDGKSYITSWGTNGHNSAGTPNTTSPSLCEIGTNVYSISRYKIAGEDEQEAYFTSWDAAGNMIKSLRVDVSPTSGTCYHALFALNENLIIGTKDYYVNWPDRVLRWTTDFAEIDSFNIPGLTASHYIKAMIPDETTRESILITPAAPESWGTQDDDQLDGAEVCVYADGVSYGTFTMDGNDIVGFTEADYDVVIAGINYWSKLETVPLPVGPRLANKKLSAIRFDLDRAYYLEYAMGANSTPIVCDFNEVITSSIRYERVTMPFGPVQMPTVYIQTDKPVPLGIRAIIPEVTWYSPR